MLPATVLTKSRRGPGILATWCCCAKTRRAIRTSSSWSAQGFTEGFYYKPRVDYELLQAAHRGADLPVRLPRRADLPRMLLDGPTTTTPKADALQYAGAFSAGITTSSSCRITASRRKRQVLPRLVRLAQETGIPLVVTNDCHYLNREDAGGAGGAHVHPDRQDPVRTKPGCA